MNRILIAVFIFIASFYVKANSIPDAFRNWPKGLEPQTIGGKVVEQFMSTEPEKYNPKGFSANRPYGGGKYVVYSVASLWVNAMEYALLTSQRNLKIKLCEKFDPFLPRRAKADKVTKPRHVDFNVFGAAPLEVAILTGEKRAKEMGLRYADDPVRTPSDAKAISIVSRTVRRNGTERFAMCAEGGAVAVFERIGTCLPSVSNQLVAL